jgi:hypothetical protein
VTKLLIILALISCLACSPGIQPVMQGQGQIIAVDWYGYAVSFTEHGGRRKSYSLFHSDRQDTLRVGDRIYLMSFPDYPDTR